MKCRDVIAAHPRTTSYLSQDEIRRFRCVRCGAVDGAWCVGRASGRSHVERLYVAQGHLLECLPYLMAPRPLVVGVKAGKRESARSERTRQDFQEWARANPLPDDGQPPPW